MRSKFIITFILALLCGITISAQKYYLKIKESEGSYISYPPGTKFVLKDQSDYIIFKETTDPEKFDFSKGKTLIVYPHYKSTRDTYHLEEGMLELVPSATRPSISDTYKVDHDYANGITMEKSYTDSKKHPGSKNVSLSFSNGVVFTYEDGDYTALQNNKQVEIEGKYLIQAEDGVIKLSYNDETGAVWWVFEPK